MSAINNGGQAFPWHERGIHHGMTLRDYFAGQALAGLMLGAKWGGAMMLATQCYEMADAMIKAREPKP